MTNIIQNIILILFLIQISKPDDTLNSSNPDQELKNIWIAFGCVLGSLIILFLVHHFYQNHTNRNIQLEMLDQSIRQSSSRQLKEDFDMVARRFLENQWKCRFIKSKLIIEVQDLIIKIKKQSDICYQLNIRGRDEFGTWKQDGTLENNENQFLIRLKKDYDDKISSIQFSQQLIYEAKLVEQNHFKGKWFYVGLQLDEEFSGEWQLEYINMNNSKFELANDG